MNILYQVPHGSRISETVGQGLDARVLLSVMRAESIIHLHVAPDEGIEHQRIALNSAVGDHRPRDTRLLLSDSPLNLDVPDINQDFGSLECIGSDPLHVALRLEKASNQKKNRLSKRVGSCMSELQNGYSDNRAYHKRGMAIPCHLDCEEALRRISDTIANRRVGRILEDAEYI